LQFLTACIASLELLQITCGCSTDGPECECFREYEGQDAELEQAARSHLGSRVFLRVSDPANLANRTHCGGENSIFAFLRAEGGKNIHFPARGSASEALAAFYQKICLNTVQLTMEFG
jgi:hypothetical protein